MKEFYHSSNFCNTAVITCKKSGSIFDLYYHLYDHPVQHTWQKLHATNSGIETYNYAGIAIEDLEKKLRDLCESVRYTNIPEKFDQEFLNTLHNEFVKNSDNNIWSEINHTIHIIESKLDNPFHVFDSTIKFYSSNNQFVPIKEEYKIFLDTDISWGRMNLGYGTLGKDWIDISRNNDELDDLALQSTISSETSLVFCVEPGIPLRDEIRFYKWSQNKNNLPLDNLNKLSLGRYPLGQLIITGSLLDFHKTASDWYVPNHKCKLNWNREVFTKDIEILEINFKNTDLLYKSFIDHSNLTGVFDA